MGNYYMNEDGRFKSWQQRQDEKQAEEAANDNESALSGVVNMLKSLFK